MAVRTASATAIDNDVNQLLTDLTTYFALANQGLHDVDIRSLFMAWLHGKFINHAAATAAAARYTNREDPASWTTTLVLADPLA